MMRSRIASAVVAAALVTGLTGCNSTPKAAQDGTPAAGGVPASTAPPGVGTDPSGSSGSSGGYSAAQLETMRNKVGAVFSQGVWDDPDHTNFDADMTEVAADFASKATMKAAFGTADNATDRPMDCGFSKYNGIVVGAFQASGADATAPVLLYKGTTPSTTIVTVTVDPASGVITGSSCGGAPDMADFPGLKPIATYYGSEVSGTDAGLAVLNDPSNPQFTSAFNAWQPALTDLDQRLCGEQVDRWVVALTDTSSSSSAWDFAADAIKSLPDPTVMQPENFDAAVTVDLGVSKISRVWCGTQPPPLDKMRPTDGPDSFGPEDYVTYLLTYYAEDADQKSLGADPKALIRPFFVSDAAFDKTWNSTGTVPLLCTNKMPNEIDTVDGSTPIVSGSHTSFKIQTWWGNPDTDGSDAEKASQFTAVFDTKTMKISSITCTKYGTR